MTDADDLFSCALGMPALLSALPRHSVRPANESLVNKTVVIVGGSVGGLAAAACLKKAGIHTVLVFERLAEFGEGAGVGLDDASMAVLLGLLGEQEMVLEPTRWIEEVRTSGETVHLAAYPYCSTRYAEVRRVLESCLEEGVVRRGMRVVKATAEFVELENGDRVGYDVLVAADGPRSTFRPLVEARDLRYAGYTAWRGTASKVSKRTQSSLFGRLGNCLYFVHEPSSIGRHGVLYDIGGGVLNWLVYETRPPSAGERKTTALVDLEAAQRFIANARDVWGECLGGVIADTRPQDIFRTDVYDLEKPLSRLATDRVVLVGDAAHAVTPHNAKGTNMALHDAAVLAAAASTATDVASWLADYSRRRATDVANTIHFSRHMGLLRNGYFTQDGDWESSARACRVATISLPTDNIFQPVWDFALSHARSFYLRPPVICQSVNHISRDTDSVDRLAHFYASVLGLPKVSRPPFDFDGAWFDLGNQVHLHIIERDPNKPKGENDSPETRANQNPVFIRRGQHLALRISDVNRAKRYLQAANVTFSEFKVPASDVTQLFFYDPDGTRAICD